jgi:uncharacterized protein with GYD domain
VAVAEVAYFLVSLDRGTPAAAARQIRQIEGVVDAHVTMGDYDIVAVAEIEGTKGFPVIAAAMRRVDGVAKVATCVIVKP